MAREEESLLSHAGIVALATGIMWGAKSDVSFALQIVALKALPVLILGGFTSIPGAIIGGLIIGVGEKLFEFAIGPLVGGALYQLEPSLPYASAAGVYALLLLSMGWLGRRTTVHVEDADT